MKILFLQKDIFAKGAIMSLSAVLKKAGYECEVLIDDLERDVVEEAYKANPDVIAFSITTPEYQWMNSVGNKIRDEFSGLIVCGGAHPTFYPEVIEDEYLDAVCQGEGEDAFIEFVTAIEAGRDITGIRNLILRQRGEIFRNDLRPLIEDLDSLPFWDRSIYDRYSLFRKSGSCVLFHMNMEASRGCPYQCSFCFNKIYNDLYHGKGKVIRRRSVNSVIEELSLLKKTGKLKFISFDDDAFLVAPRQWLTDFLELYQNEIYIPFKIMASADLLDEDLVSKLKESNCYAIRMGIEVGNEHYRREVLKKNVTNDHITKAVKLAKKYNIKVQAFNMMGGPGETLEMAFETYDLNRELRPDYSWCVLLNPYPGTEIYDYSVRNGYLNSSFGWQEAGHFYGIDTPLQITNKSAIHNLQKLMYFSLVFHFPKWLLAFLIKLPLGKFFNLLFGIGYFIGLSRINKESKVELAKLSFTRFLKYIY